MKAFEVFAIYVTPFLLIGIAIRFLMTRYGVSLSDVEKQVGSKPKRRFLLGAWRTDE
jgi:antitoxin component HigA of HigAB toxin-antitoxin module